MEFWKFSLVESWKKVVLVNKEQELLEKKFYYLLLGIRVILSRVMFQDIPPKINKNGLEEWIWISEGTFQK